MPSKGSRIVTFRMPAELDIAAKAAIDRRNQFSRCEPWDLSKFIISAIVEKIAHLDRSSGRKGKRKTEAKKASKKKEETNGFPQTD